MLSTSHHYIADLDRANSFFELISITPCVFSLVELWKAKKPEGLSFFSTCWWFIYLGWATYYLWALDQPISASANFLMFCFQGTMVWVLLKHLWRNSRVIT